MKKDKFFIWCTVRRRLSKGSLSHTRIRYNYLFRWLGKRKLTADTAEEFILFLREKGLRHASLNGYIRILKLIDDFERENDHDLNLLKRIDYFPKQKKVPTILTFEEIQAIIDAPIPLYAGTLTSGRYTKGILEERNKFLNSTYKNAIWFLAATGCRYEEMASLRVDNLQLGIADGYAIFKDTKTMDDREVPLPPLLVESLKEHIKGKKPSDLVFTSSRGNHLAEQTFNPFLRRKVEGAGITHKHVHAHVFRYSYIMEHIRRGTGHLTISKLVGHRDANTTLGYTRYDRTELVKGAENHPFFSRHLPAEKVLEKANEAAQKLPGLDDPRFETKISRSSTSFFVEIALAKCYK